MIEANVPSNSPEAGHEPTDLSPEKIALFALALTAMIVAALVVTYVLFQHFLTVEMRTQTAPSPLAYTREPTPEPHLSANPGQDLKTMRAEEDKILKSYGWVDKEKGIVRIPIDRAIEILAQRGLPTRKESRVKGAESRSSKSNAAK